jgi:hypothetical protein
MAKGKVIKSSTPAFAKAGTTKMFGKQHAGPQKSLTDGSTGKRTSGSGGKWGKGGSTHMFGKQTAGPRRPGVTGK